uniref:Uncharacterized protein n=1 Tax=Rhizophora mucronata TaxID=61149 RepID=A0A2P2IJZ4_RHIMU
MMVKLSGCFLLRNTCNSTAWIGWLHWWITYSD